MIIKANTLHGLFNYTVYNIFIAQTVATPAAESLIHSLFLVTLFYLFIEV
jgi:hypothetical protein